MIFEGLSQGSFNAVKCQWMTDIWVPACRKYLSLAEAGDEQDSFTLKQVCQNDDMLYAMRIKMEEVLGVNIEEPEAISFKYSEKHFD